MLSLISYRGPDDEGQEWVETRHGWTGLGNRRLAIMDTSMAGHQPMERDGNLLAYNGEIYNFTELRAELEQSGERFHSGTDTEVVLALLNRCGTAGLRRLNGMFALAWWDSSAGELVLARDRFGIKPLVYTFDGGELLFASEAKCLVAVRPHPELELSALPSYLAFGWVAGNRTLIRGVNELPPGHILRWSNGSIKLEQFRAATPLSSPVVDSRDAAQLVRERLADSVRRQLVADVPVGVLLSGGLDSTSIAAFAAQSTTRPVSAYTIAFRSQDAILEQSADDVRFARLAARRLGLSLHEFEIKPDIAGLMERVSWHLDDPVADPAAILTLLISEAARGDVKVLLSGQGADELFAGYRVHVYSRLASWVNRLPTAARLLSSALVDEMPQLAAKLPARAKPGLFLGGHRALRMIFDHAELPEEERYIAFRSAYYFSGRGLVRLLNGDIHAQLLGEDPALVHHAVFSDQSELQFVDRMLAVDIATFLVNQNLAYSDRLSMAASIELRVPFLDDAVADVALQIPGKLKLHGLRGKAVLREAVKDVVPPEIMHRRKAGFGAPIRSWLRNDLVDFVADALSLTWLERTGLFNPHEVSVLLDQHISGKADHTYRIWTLLCFSLWWRQYMEGGLSEKP